ncbi:hypothetical protein [Streptomyces puniciscabiei]|uniref:hypothetical protein n=1 Tax=Streptomyces puniciscabiei TaxID=164348 RepID=UPI001153CF6F|nr:hypothetical protein [Streptomyces puniciscabiei]
MFDISNKGRSIEQSDDREPVNAVNTSRMYRLKLRNIRTTTHRPAHVTPSNGWLVSDLTPEGSDVRTMQTLDAAIESFAQQSEISSAESIDDPRSRLNHPCLRNRAWFEIPGCVGLGNPCCTADQRPAARQTRASHHLRHPVPFR